LNTPGCQISILFVRFQPQLYVTQIELSFFLVAIVSNIFLSRKIIIDRNRRKTIKVFDQRMMQGGNQAIPQSAQKITAEIAKRRS
jgi:hypothetical protein